MIAPRVKRHALLVERKDIFRPTVLRRDREGMILTKDQPITTTDLIRKLSALLTLLLKPLFKISLGSQLPQQVKGKDCM